MKRKKTWPANLAMFPRRRCGLMIFMPEPGLAAVAAGIQVDPVAKVASQAVPVVIMVVLPLELVAPEVHQVNNQIWF